MKDYRLPRTKKSRSRRSSPSQSGFFSGIKLFFLKILLVLVALGLVLVGIFFLTFKVIYPRLADLDLSTTIVIVPSSEDLNSNALLIAQYDAKEQRVTVTQLTTEEETEVIGGFGMYPLKSLYPLLKLEAKDDLYLRAAYSAVLGQVVDGVIESDQTLEVASMPQLRELVYRDLLTHPLSMWTARSQIQLLSVAGQLAQNELRQQTFSSLAEWEAYTQRQNLSLPDANCPVAVVNTTAVSGLATEVSRIVEGSNYTVIRVGHTASPVAKSQVVVDPTAAECLKHAQRLQNVIPLQSELKQDADQTSTFRSKIIIFIGEDASQIWES